MKGYPSSYVSYAFLCFLCVLKRLLEIFFASCGKINILQSLIGMTIVKDTLCSLLSNIDCLKKPVAVSKNRFFH
jgi:hypothetical protein